MDSPLCLYWWVDWLWKVLAALPATRSRAEQVSIRTPLAILVELPKTRLRESVKQEAQEEREERGVYIRHSAQRHTIPPNPQPASASTMLLTTTTTVTPHHSHAHSNHHPHPNRHPQSHSLHTLSMSSRNGNFSPSSSTRQSPPSFRGGDRTLVLTLNPPPSKLSLRVLVPRCSRPRWRSPYRRCPPAFSRAGAPLETWL